MKKFKTEIHFSLLVITILLMNLLMSCSVSKQLHQDKTTTQTQTTTNENTVASNQTVSTTKITETSDTNIVISGSELSVVAKFRDLLNGDTVFATGEGLSIKTFYDSLTKTVKSQARSDPKTVTFYVKKVTEKQEVATGTVTSNKQEIQKQTVKLDIRDKEVKRSGFPWWGYFVILFILACAAIGIFLKVKKYI
jgi:hypothetical protein